MWRFTFMYNVYKLKVNFDHLITKILLHIFKYVFYELDGNSMTR